MNTFDQWLEKDISTYEGRVVYLKRVYMLSLLNLIGESNEVQTISNSWFVLLE